MTDVVSQADIFADGSLVIVSTRFLNTRFHPKGEHPCNLPTYHYQKQGRPLCNSKTIKVQTEIDESEAIDLGIRLCEICEAMSARSN